MRTVLYGLGILGINILAGGTWAGVYLPPRADPFPVKTDHKLFQLRLGPRQQLLTTKSRKPTEAERKKSPFLNEVWQDIEALEAKRAANDLTVEEGIRLGGRYLMVNDHVNEALKVLQQMQEREPKNFMLLGNLAMTYFRLGELSRAVEYQSQLLNDAWPRSVEGWSAAQLRWQRRVETYFLTFLRQRAEAARLDPQPSGVRPLKMDNLFPPVRFVGRDGKFVVGEIDPRQMDRLPPDAIALVQQIILWLPEGESQGLMWLLAELYNAHDELRPAEGILVALVEKLGTGVQELNQHRRALQEAVAALPPPKIEVETPQGLPEEETPGVLPNWRTFAVGLGVGILVGVLLLFQWRQLFGARR